MLQELDAKKGSSQNESKKFGGIKERGKEVANTRKTSIPNFCQEKVPGGMTPTKVHSSQKVRITIINCQTRGGVKTG